MKRPPYTFCFLLFLLADVKANTVIYFAAPDVKISTVLFLNYLTGDTLYFSDKSSAVVSLPELRYKETMVLIINNNQRDKKRITIESDTVKFQIVTGTDEKEHALQFQSGSFNAAYYNFKTEIGPQDKLLKKLLQQNINTDSLFPQIDSLRKSINKLALNFYTGHTNSFLALDFVSTFLQMNEFDKSLLKKIFIQLDSGFAVYTQWDYCRLALNAGSDFLAEGDTMLNTTLYNDKNQLVSLDSIIVGKNTYLVFWASWCAGCMEEIKDINTKANLIDSLKLNVVFICLDEKINTKIRERFKATRNMLFTNSGFDNGLVMHSGLTQLPYGMLVSKSGIVKAKGIDFKAVLGYNVE